MTEPTIPKFIPISKNLSKIPTTKVKLQGAPIVFDNNDRQTFLNGFSKRRKLRQKIVTKELEKVARSLKLHKRAEKREEKKRILDEYYDRPELNQDSDSDDLIDEDISEKEEENNEEFDNDDNTISTVTIKSIELPNNDLFNKPNKKKIESESDGSESDEETYVKMFKKAKNNLPGTVDLTNGGFESFKNKSYRKAMKEDQYMSKIYSKEFKNKPKGGSFNTSKKTDTRKKKFRK